MGRFAVVTAHELLDLGFVLFDKVGAQVGVLLFIIIDCVIDEGVLQLIMLILLFIFIGGVAVVGGRTGKNPYIKLKSDSLSSVNEEGCKVGIREDGGVTGWAVGTSVGFSVR